MAYFIVGCMLVFGAIYINYVAGRLAGVELDAVSAGIVAFKTVVEVLAALYGALFIFSAISEALPRQKTFRRRLQLRSYTSVAKIWTWRPSIAWPHYTTRANYT